jgi:hypothetical protein
LEARNEIEQAFMDDDWSMRAAAVQIALAKWTPMALPGDSAV